MSYIGVKINGLIQKMAGMPLMDVAFSNRSTNGVQNKIITAWKNEIESILTGKVSKTALNRNTTGLEFNTNVFTDENSVFYENDYMAQVTIDGKITQGSDGTLICTLPVGHRADHEAIGIIAIGTTAVYCLLASDGTIKVKGGVSISGSTICRGQVMFLKKTS